MLATNVSTSPYATISGLLGQKVKSQCHNVNVFVTVVANFTKIRSHRPIYLGLDPVSRLSRDLSLASVTLPLLQWP